MIFQFGSRRRVQRKMDGIPRHPNRTRSCIPTHSHCRILLQSVSVQFPIDTVDPIILCTILFWVDYTTKHATNTASSFGRPFYLPFVHNNPSIPPECQSTSLGEKFKVVRVVRLLSPPTTTTLCFNNPFRLHAEEDSGSRQEEEDTATVVITTTITTTHLDRILLEDCHPIAPLLLPLLLLVPPLTAHHHL